MVGCSGEKSPEPAQNSDKATIGVISHLNASETEYNEYMEKLEKSYRPSKAHLSANYKYFDKMNDMQLALESNQIDMLLTYKNVANYMLQRSDDKEILPTERILSNSFCFAVREGDKMLQNDLNKAIKAMEADGTPAGFSTAVLAEISKRINKNIELVSIDSAARAAILASKGADVVFWVAVPKYSNLIPANIDQPAGISIIDPYYHDNIVHVGLKK